MEEKTRSIIKQYDLITSTGRILAAVSGGADSVVLIHVLKRLGFSLYAAHINHMIRGDEALRDELFVESLCKELNIPLRVYRKDCPGYAAAHKLSLEDAARLLRYEALEEARLALGCQKIATAHTENDNVETLLMRLIRGTSPYGLRGIDIKRGHIIRPLLYSSRSEIINYAKEHGLSYVTDSSNKDMAYLRNKVRHELLTKLESSYNPNIRDALNRLSQNLKTDADYFAAEAERAFNKYTAFLAGAVLISAEAYKELHPAVFTRLIRRTVKHVAGSEKDLSYTHTNMIAGLFTMKSGKRVSLTKGLLAANSFGSVAIYKKNPLPLPEQALKPGDFIQVGESGYFVSLSPEKNNFRESLISTCTGVFICDKMMDSLVIRGRRNGDTLSLPSGKTLKLKDFFTERRIPVFLRDSIYVVACGSAVLMVLLDEPFTAAADDENREKKLYIELLRKTVNNRPPQKAMLSGGPGKRLTTLGGKKPKYDGM